MKDTLKTKKLHKQLYEHASNIINWFLIL